MYYDPTDKPLSDKAPRMWVTRTWVITHPAWDGALVLDTEARHTERVMRHQAWLYACRTYPDYDFEPDQFNTISMVTQRITIIRQ
jgi:hypothetical protein